MQIRVPRRLVNIRTFYQEHLANKCVCVRVCAGVKPGHAASVVCT